MYDLDGARMTEESYRIEDAARILNTTVRNLNNWVRKAHIQVYTNEIDKRLRMLRWEDIGFLANKYHRSLDPDPIEKSLEMRVDTLEQQVEELDELVQEHIITSRTNKRIANAFRSAAEGRLGYNFEARRTFKEQIQAAEAKAINFIRDGTSGPQLHDKEEIVVSLWPGMGPFDYPRLSRHDWLHTLREALDKGWHIT